MRDTKNVNVSLKMDKDTVFGGAIFASACAAIIMFCSNQRTKRLELKQNAQKELHDYARDIRA